MRTEYFFGIKDDTFPRYECKYHTLDCDGQLLLCATCVAAIRPLENGLNRHFNSTFKRLWEEHRLQRRGDRYLFLPFLINYDWQQCDEVRYAWNTLQECETCAHLSVVFVLTLDTENFDATETDADTYASYKAQFTFFDYTCVRQSWKIEYTFEGYAEQ